MTNRDAIANLKTAMLAVQTVGEIHALIVDYTYEEIEQAYNQLPPQQQTKLKAICDRDTHPILDFGFWILDWGRRTRSEF